MDDVKKFLGAGCTRVAYSLGNGWCEKVPIKGREEAGIIQNKTEYENFKLGAKFGCFPKVKSHSRDFSRIVVEECAPICDFDLMKYFETGYLKAVKTDIIDKYKIPAARFIGLDIFGFIEELRSETIKASGFGIESILKLADEIHDFDSLLAFLDTASAVPLEQRRFFNTNCTIARVALDEIPVVRRVVSFWIKNRDKLYIRDLWNTSQYGQNQYGEIVVVDAGYTKKLANSEHFKRVSIDKTNYTTTEDLDTFNGKSCAEMFSDSGSPVKWKFFTSRGTEYVLSAAGQSQRIKKAGLKDDGLHSWTDKLLFVDEQDAINAMNKMTEIMQTLTPVKIESSFEPGSKLDIQQLVEDQWKTQLSIVVRDVEPKIGKNVLEFSFDGDYIVKGFHAGHDVVRMKQF